MVYPVARKDSIARIDYEIRGLRCPVDHCNGALDFVRFAATTQPSFLRSSVLYDTPLHQYRTDGWVEVEFLCKECGATGQIKAQMRAAPISAKTKTGARYLLTLGRPPKGGI